MNKSEKIKTEKEDRLQTVRISDYRKLGDEVKEWTEGSEEMPEYFWNKIKDLDLKLPLREALNRILEELFAVYGKKRDQGNSFGDSRFTTLSEMIDCGMVSCGALAKIFGTILRKLGIPVRFVHGILEGQKGENRHSWLEVYDPAQKNWIEVDPTRHGFGMEKEAKRINIYHDWTELEDDYKKGKF